MCYPFVGDMGEDDENELKPDIMAGGSGTFDWGIFWFVEMKFIVVPSYWPSRKGLTSSIYHFILILSSFGIRMKNNIKICKFLLRKVKMKEGVNNPKKKKKKP